MEMRVDIVSRTTGRVLLSSLFDTPPDGLTRKDTVRVIQQLVKAKKQLEGVVGKDLVRLSVGDYNSSVFWYLVLFRPVFLGKGEPVFGEERQSAYEIIQDPGRASALKKLNLGLVHDPERNWLTLVWPEALERGVLAGLDSPTWNKVLKDNKATSVEWWKLCAESHSFVVPKWRLRRLGYIRKMLWYHQGIDYTDITTFDLTGIDVPRIDQQGRCELPTAVRARYTHYYTEDRREFTDLRKREEKKLAGSLAARPRRNVRRKEKRAEDAHAQRQWARASRLVCKLPGLVGSPVVLRGRYPKYLSGPRAAELCDAAVVACLNGALNPRETKYITRANRSLDELEELLNDPYVPEEFGQWLQWRDGGAAITGRKE